MAAIDKWVSGATPDMLMGEVAQRALEARLRSVIHFLPLAAHLAEENVEYVHATRVATRRAVAALDLFRNFIHSPRRKRMKVILKRIRSSMGEARDLDVYIKQFAYGDDAVADSLAVRLEQQRCNAQMPIIACATPLLAGQHLRSEAAKLVRSTKKYAPKKLRRRRFDKWAEQQLQRAWRNFVGALPGDNPHAEDLHEFRIASKRFRYTLELLNNGLPTAIRKQLYSQVKQLQAQLGEIQDHAVAAEKLAAWCDQATTAAEQAMLQQYAHDELEQFNGKSQAFLGWWRRDRIYQMRSIAFPESLALEE